jgi:predicted dehydrogenase
LFLNEAGDEGLGPEHWFWDRDTSGGIFVEHGVHFLTSSHPGWARATWSRRWRSPAKLISSR